MLRYVELRGVGHAGVTVFDARDTGDSAAFDPASSWRALTAVADLPESSGIHSSSSSPLAAFNSRGNDEERRKRYTGRRHVEL